MTTADPYAAAWRDCRLRRPLAEAHARHPWLALGLGAEVRATVPEFLCSFCKKSHRDVRTLIPGPDVFICDACLGLCNDILAERQVPQHQRLGQRWPDAEADKTVALMDDAGLATLQANVLEAHGSAMDTRAAIRSAVKRLTPAG